MDTEFSKHVKTLLTGTVLAQLIPILTLPILSRLFTAEEFGIFSTCVAIAAFLAVIFTYRYELAIVLAKDETEASKVFSLVILIATGMAVSFLVAMLLFYSPLSSSKIFSSIRSELLLTILTAWLIAINQVFICWANRHNQYGRIALAGIVQQSVAAVVRFVIGFGFVLLVLNGLFLGSVIGWGFSILSLLLLTVRFGPRPRLLFSYEDIKSTAKKFRKFPVFNTPYSLLGTFSRDFLIYLLSGFGLLASAGHFGFARSCVSVPITFLSSSLGQVYFQRIANRIGSPEVEELTVSLMTKLRVVFLPVFAALFVWGADVFALLFGENWREAGQYASIYSPAIFLFLFSSWPERIFESSGKQSLALKIQLISDLITVSVLWIMLANSISVILVIGAYSFLSCCYHLIYINGLFHAAGFRMNKLYRFLVDILLHGCIWVTILAVVHYLMTGSLLLGLSLSALLILGYLYSVRDAILSSPAGSLNS